MKLCWPAIRDTLACCTSSNHVDISSIDSFSVSIENLSKKNPNIQPDIQQSLVFVDICSYVVEK